MGPLSRSAILSALAAACLGGALAAQPAADAGFAESIDVDVVDIDVFVSDRAGRPVPGLTREDFELRVDGKPVAITNFAAGAAAGRPAAAGTPATARTPTTAPAAPAPALAEAASGGAHGAAIDQPLTLALFIDDRGLSPGARNPTLRQLEGFFRGALHPRDRVLIARYDGVDVQLLLPAAGDGVAAVAALREVGAKMSRGANTTNDWTKAWQDLADAETLAQGTAAVEQLRMLRFRREGEAQRVLRTLGSFVDSLAGLRGRKALLYLSGELQVPAGDGAVRDLVRRANAAEVTVYGLGAQDDLAAIFIGTTKLAEFGIDPAGFGNGSGDRFAATLQEIVGPTGGVAAVDLNRPAFLLERIREDFSSFYSLGFAPPPAPDSGDTVTHRVEVRVRGRSGLQVRFPATYTARSREERLADRTRTALRLDAPGAGDNPLGVRLGFEHDELAAYGRRAVTVLVTLPLARVTLRPGQGVHDGKVEMLVAVRDSTGHELRMRRITLPLHVPDGELAAVERKSAAYRLRLDLPPGTSTLALGVRDELGNRESTVATKYVAGALAAAKAAVGPAGTAPPPGGR